MKIFILLCSTLMLAVTSNAMAATPSVSLTSPSNATVYASPPASLTLRATASEKGGSITKVEFFANGNKLGEDTTSPYTFNWSNPAVGSYNLTAKATDRLRVSKTSAIVKIRVNAAPSISITSPSSGASFTAPANLTVTANASDSDGSIASVRFYRNGSLITTDTAAPYSASWANLAAGTYTLIANATDNNGRSINSAAVTITVLAPNVPPSVSMTSPNAGATYAEPASLDLSANATDSDGNISKVEFYQGSTLIGTASTSPYTISWSEVAAGSYTLTAKATDNRNATSTSSSISITVSPKPDTGGNAGNFCPTYTQSPLYAARARANRIVVSPPASPADYSWLTTISSAAPNTEILLQDGVYHFPDLYALTYDKYQVKDNITVRSFSGNRDAVKIVGAGYRTPSEGFLIAGKNSVIADISITQMRNHGIAIKGELGAEAPHIYNVHLYNIGTQFIKGTPDTTASGGGQGDGVSNTVIACSRFDYIDDEGKTKDQWKEGDYNGAIDLHRFHNSLIRDNYVSEMTGTGSGCEVDSCGQGYIPNPSIFAWNQSSGTITERNTLINNFRGISYGLGRGHSGGIIRNNFIYRPQTLYHLNGNVAGDAGIELQNSTGALVAHNTVYTPGYPGAIEAREGANNLVFNNFITSPVWNRGDTNLSIQGNIDNLQSSDLIASTDPHLKFSNSRAVGACSALADITTDIDGQSRAGRCDVGADFYSNGSNTAPDSDEDGVPDSLDNCASVSNTSQMNTDQDSEGNACDVDDDNDGVLDVADAFPLDLTESFDSDADGSGNNADSDDDGDNIADNLDNCPLFYNVNQADADHDGVGDACDATPNPVTSTTISLQEGANGYSGTQDTFIGARAYPPENVANFGGATVLRTFSVDDRRILIRFDLSQIPAGSTVSAANLAFFMQSNDYPSNPNIDCYRLTQDWAEGTKVNEWDTPADGVSWSSRGPGKGNWTQAGGSIAEKICSSSVAVGQFTSCDLKSALQQWVNGSAANYGVMCSNSVSYANDMIFSSSESSTAANRPKLTITYGTSGSGGGTPPPPPPPPPAEPPPSPPPPPAPEDTDGDGIADANDNCPGTVNVNQADSDNDGIGDVCDATPTGSGPGQSSGNLRNTRMQNIQNQVASYANNNTLGQATTLTALHRSGQTFLTWTENSSISGESYVLYRSNSPINATNIASANPIAVVKENSSYYRTEASRPNSVQQRFVIQDGGTPLSSNTALFVNTPAEGGNFYYAVATVSGNQINKSGFSASNSLSSAVAEAVNDPKPILVAAASGNGHTSRIYTQFMDYHNWNPSVHGYAYNYSVSVESSYVPTGNNLVPITVHIDGKNTRYTNVEPYGGGIWISIDAPYYSSYAEQDWYWGYSCYNNFNDATRTTVDDGPICNFSELRMLRALKDTIQDPYYSNHADPKRIYAWGHSMGASGSLSWAMHYPQIFSIVYASEGMTDYASDPVWRNENEGRWGSVGRNNPVLNLGLTWVDGSSTSQNIESLNGMGVWDFMDHKTLACDPEYADKETAFIIATHGTNDGTIQAASQGYPFYKCLDSGKRGYIGQVNAAYHGWQDFQPSANLDFRMLANPWNVYEDAIPLTTSVDKNFPLQSYIAFSNTSGSDLAANSGLSDYNLNVMWDVNQIVDLSNRYEALLYTSSGSVNSTLTLRRLQNFQAVAGHNYTWQNFNSNGQLVASGNATADAHGLISIPNFSISNGGNHLIVNY